VLGVEDPRKLYHADAELLALWGGYFSLKSSPETPISNDVADIDQQVAMCERLLM